MEEGLPVGLAGLSRGDYVLQTKGVKSGKFRLPWYAFAPDENSSIKVNERGLFKGTYFGPVHEIRDTRHDKGFVSVRVPTPFTRPSQLVWINVLKCKTGDSWQSCKRVPTTEVEAWVRRGWCHEFID